MTWDHDRFMAADFETSGTLPEYALQPWRVAQGKAWVTSLSYCKFVGNRLKPHGGLHPTKEMMREMLELAIAEKRTIVGWNIVFDIAWLIAYGLEDLVFQVKWLDGMLLWRHWFIEPEYEVTRANKVSYALKPGAMDEFLPVYAGYNDDVDFHSTDPAELKKLQKYNDRDTLATYTISMIIYDRLAEDPKRLKAALIEADSLPMIAQANLNGMLVDTLATRELEAHLSATADRLLEALEPHGVTEKVVRSPLQLAKIMYDEWKLPVLKENTSKLTGKVSRSTDKEVLHELAFVDPRARQVKEYREALGNRAKFADAVLASVDYNEDGRTHPQARVFSTYTGRMAYSSKQGKNKDERQTGFALHQEKRGKEFRDILISPPGYTLMEADFAGQEFRWMAIAARDPVMLKLCEPGEDAHSYMAARIYERDYQQFMVAVESKADGFSDMRRLGKVGNLSLQYRTSARKLRSVARVQYSIPMEMVQAYFIHSTYQKSYNRVPVYWNEQIGMTKQTGYVETFAGRRVQVVGDWEGSFGWSMGSTAINYRIQGCLQPQVRVHTDRGLVPIKELVGQTFSVWTGHRWAAATAVSRGVCRFAEVELTTGEVIECDTRHKLKTDDRRWVEFSEFKAGMMVALPRLREPPKASAEVTWPYVLGSYLGDGWVFQTKRVQGWRRQVAIVGCDKDLGNLVRIRAFWSARGFETKLTQRKPNLWLLQSERRDLFDEMVRQGVTPGLNARTKRIPEVVWRLDEQGRRDFWEGVHHTDGAKLKGQEGNIHTPNRELVCDLQRLCSSIGLASHVSRTKAAWLLRILRVDGGIYPKDRLLSDLDGFVPPCRMRDCESIVDRRAVTGGQQVTQRVAERIYDRWMPDVEVYRYAEIKEVRVLDRAEETYTLSVDDPLHQFVADGVVHKNTGADQKYLALSVLRPYLREIGAYFAFELHDGIQMWVPDHMVSRAAVEIRHLLDNLPYKKAWGFIPPIPLPVDIKTGGAWGSTKPYKFD